MDSMTLATETCAAIEANYPEFLTDVEQEDTKITKAGYYLTVLQVAKDVPLPDENAQKIVVQWLKDQYSMTEQQARSEILSQFWL